MISEGVRLGRPVTRVLYGESGFVVLDAEMADEDPDRHGVDEFRVVCLDCLLERHPEAGGGMDVAKRTGASRLHEGVWRAEGR